MKNIRYLKIISILLTIVFSLLVNRTIAQIPTDSRRDALVSAGIDGTCQIDSVNCQRYDIFPGFAECGELLDSVKKYNSGALVMLYNSGTDNYTTPGVTSGNYYGGAEHTYLRSRCIELGYSPEILYLHFYDDTELSGWSIPGTYGTTLSDKDSVSRAPDYLNYYSGDGIGRILVNYSHPITRQLEIEYACMVFDSLECSLWRNLNGRTTHFDGIYLDNWMHNYGERGYGSMGRIDAGGLIVETPGSGLIYGTEEFAEWYWEQMKLFATALHDTLETGASWAPDGRRKYLAINVGQSWNSDYTSADLAGGDFVVMEFLYSPVKNPNASIYGLPGMTTKDSLCAVNNVALVYCSRQMIGDDGEYSWGDAVYNNMAAFYALCSSESYLFQRSGLGAPYTAQANVHFDSLAWRGCMDYDLGNALGHYEILETGTDPKGQSYKVFSREYQKGLVLIRPLDDWGQEFDADTKITVNLSGGYRKLEIDGSLGTVLTSVELQNGSGAVLIPADMGDCTESPTTPALYSPGNGEEVGTKPTLCVSNSDGGDCLVGLSYDFQIAFDAGMNEIVAERYGVAEGSSITCYTASVDLSTGTYYWRARAYNGTVYSGWSSVRSFTVAGSVDNSPPSVPALSDPENGAEVSSLTPVLSIYNSYDENGDDLTYNFQVSSNSGFTAVIAQESGVAEGASSITSWTVNTALQDGTGYYWRVRAFDGSECSYWSSSRSFTIQSGENNIPSIPYVYSPSDGDVVNTFWPSLIIENSNDPDGDHIYYDFQVSISSTFAVITAETENFSQSSASTTSWTVPVQLSDNTSYWWRVRSFDGSLYSAYCEPSGFLVNTSYENESPGTPSPNSPYDGEVVAALSPMIRVNNAMDEDGDHLTYQFEVWDNMRISLITTSPAVVEGFDGTTAWQIDKILERGHRYYWKCRANDGNEYGPWMDWIDFVVSSIVPVNNPPSAPVLLIPADGDTLVSNSHLLMIGNSGDDDGDELTYEFSIARDYDMTLMVEQALEIPEGAATTTSYFTQADLNDGIRYYWRARAFDNQEWSEWSLVRDFVHYDLATDAEDIPIGLEPCEGETISSIRPDFKLVSQLSDEGVLFFFEISESEDFTDRIQSGPVKGTYPMTVWTPETDLKTNTTYFWRARAENSDWSRTISFKVLGDIHIAPNPYRPYEHGGEVVFKNIPSGANIKVVGINGDIIKEFANLPGPEVRWDVTNGQGNKLASGVYLYYVNFNGGTVTGKLAIIR